MQSSFDCFRLSSAQPLNFAHTLCGAYCASGYTTRRNIYLSQRRLVGCETCLELIELHSTVPDELAPWKSAVSPARAYQKITLKNWKQFLSQTKLSPVVAMAGAMIMRRQLKDLEQFESWATGMMRKATRALVTKKQMEAHSNRPEVLVALDQLYERGDQIRLRGKHSLFGFWWPHRWESAWTEPKTMTPWSHGVTFIT